MEKRIDILEEACSAWQSLASFRADRARNKRYTYGRQWNDEIVVDGVRMTEEQYIRQQGNIPLKNNLIRRLVRNVLGVFRNNWEKPQCRARDDNEESMAEILNSLLDYNMELNRMEELYARTLEEFLISGLAVHRKWYGNRAGRVDCWTDSVPSDNFFINSAIGDFRGWDITLIGELHDMTLDDLCSRMARNSKEMEKIKEIYNQYITVSSSGHEFAAEHLSSGFYAPAVAGMVRVIEVWRSEFAEQLLCHDRHSGKMWHCPVKEISKIEKENKRRAEIGEATINTKWESVRIWHYYYLSPEGDVLRSGVSPYPGHSHPYIFKAYPFIDGEIHSFVADVIDQQRYTNRLITLYDWVMRSSAKGVLLFPEGSLPDGTDISMVADEWSRFNGVITYKAKSGVPQPQQVSSNATNIGITDLLQIQLKMFEDISGVNGALQGRLDSGAVSGTLYSQQTRNSMTALCDLLSSYQTFVTDGVIKDAENLWHFYSKEKIQAIAGKNCELFSYPTRNFGDMRSDFTFEN